MYRRLQIPLQLQPPLTRIPLRRLPIVRARVHEAAGFVGRFAVVGRFDECLDVETVGFCYSC